jgi:outer membrane protein assembly factor BamE (lipoprotein component of BamABCDE complex)
MTSTRPMISTRQLLVLSLLVLLAAAALAALGLRPIDGIAGNLYAPIFGDETEWADGYTDQAFRAVGVGMTTQEVCALLGDPLECSTNAYDNKSVYRWTRPHGSIHYRQRDVVFDGNVVIEKIGEYRLD